MTRNTTNQLQRPPQRFHEWYQDRFHVDVITEADRPCYELVRWGFKELEARGIQSIKLGKWDMILFVLFVASYDPERCTRGIQILNEGYAHIERDLLRFPRFLMPGLSFGSSGSNTVKPFLD
jgi:hypothetical protein